MGIFKKYILTRKKYVILFRECWKRFKTHASRYISNLREIIRGLTHINNVKVYTKQSSRSGKKFVTDKIYLKQFNKNTIQLRIIISYIVICSNIAFSVM